MGREEDRRDGGEGCLQEWPSIPSQLIPAPLPPGATCFICHSWDSLRTLSTGGHWLYVFYRCEVFLPAACFSFLLCSSRDAWALMLLFYCSTAEPLVDFSCWTAVCICTQALVNTFALLLRKHRVVGFLSGLCISFQEQLLDCSPK